MEAGPVEPLGDGVDLAVVDPRVEVAERLGDRLDALVVRAHLRELRARGVVVARLVGGGERLDRGHELRDLVLHEGGVEVDGLLLLLGIRPVDRDRVAGHREAGPADAVADHAGLQSVKYSPGWATTVRVRDAPGAMFSTSPTIRRPSSASR